MAPQPPKLYTKAELRRLLKAHGSFRSAARADGVSAEYLRTTAHALGVASPWSRKLAKADAGRPKCRACGGPIPGPATYAGKRKFCGLDCRARAQEG